MKRKEIEQMKNLPVAELAKAVKNGREHLRVMKFDLAAGKVKDVRELRESKKNIARALTLMKIAEKKR